MGESSRLIRTAAAALAGKAVAAAGEKPAMSSEGSPSSSSSSSVPKWLTFERLTTLLSLAFAAGCLLTTMNALSQRVQKLEEWREAQNVSLTEFKLEVSKALATLLERTDPSRKHP